ncbi:hypothetical protein IF1G_04619 [Cordyceps javanica]|uniref:Uncharacterized protein n=1 Tax=Cordyceps javanica TaxID=43265 RepID=A0A545V6M3_9HYPO|nr:hypothetical protein IF1G_04619 [Cordyceps javanica]
MDSFKQALLRQCRFEMPTLVEFTTIVGTSASSLITVREWWRGTDGDGSPKSEYCEKVGDATKNLETVSSAAAPAAVESAAAAVGLSLATYQVLAADAASLNDHHSHKLLCLSWVSSDSESVSVLFALY